MSSKIGKKFVLFIVIVIFLPVGILVMDTLCTINSVSISNPEWLEISNNLCLTFTNTSQLIKNVINRN